MEKTFSALSVCPCWSARTHGDYSNNNISRYEEDRKIEEGITLLVRRELDGKKIVKCWTCNVFGHFPSKCPKREKKYKINFRPRRPRDCLYANEDDESKERV